LARLAGGAGHAVGALSLRTSMRNQLPCTVLALRPGTPGVLAELGLPGGLAMQALITRESAQLLDLRKGLSVLALCKAAAVEMVPAAKRGDGRNLLAGTVARAARGEVVLTLPGGLQLVGFAPTGWVARRGNAAVACVDAAAVVVALA
jgi:molybdate transport system regulatory protein